MIPYENNNNKYIVKFIDHRLIKLFINSWSIFPMKFPFSLFKINEFLRLLSLPLTKSLRELLIFK